MPHPIVIAGLIRVCVDLIRERGPSIAGALIDARHPDSEGGRRMTRDERRKIALAILSGVVHEADEGN